MKTNLFLAPNQNNFDDPDSTEQIHFPDSIPKYAYPFFLNLTDTDMNTLIPTKEQLEYFSDLNLDYMWSVRMLYRYCMYTNLIDVYDVSLISVLILL